MSELKPCPFCGGEAENEFLSDGMNVVACKVCRTSQPLVYGTRLDAAAAWNRRDALVGTLARVAELEAANVKLLAAVERYLGLCSEAFCAERLGRDLGEGHYVATEDAHRALDAAIALAKR